MSGLPTRVVKVEQVIDLLNVSHAPDVIQNYAEKMRGGQCFPPISVFPLGRRYIITDGHKRFNACRVLQLEKIEVEVWTSGRLVADLGGQFGRYVRAAGTAGAQFFRGSAGRQEARKFFAGTVAHWRRMALSLCRLFKRQT